MDQFTYAERATDWRGNNNIAAQMKAQGKHGSIVTLICDDGERYADTYYSDSWVVNEGLDPAHIAAALDQFDKSGELNFDR